jgi:osmotically-inducible protein OsmY
MMGRVAPTLVAAALTLAWLATGCTSNDADKAAKDALLVATVKAKLATLDVDTVTNVRVSAHDGAVDLRGAVRAQAEIARLRSAANSVSGVKAVSEELSVDPHMPSSKAKAQSLALALRVRGNIAAQAGLNAFSVQPNVKGDVVTLDGTVRSMALKTIVMDAARHTSGVHVVIDRVKVAR